MVSITIINVVLITSVGDKKCHALQIGYFNLPTGERSCQNE